MRRQRLLFAAIAVVLVLFRSFVPTFYEGFYFDSDQAIVGLMARHLSSFQHFPLYYYGLNYLLAVQAWIIAPFFLLFRSSVAVMRIPLIALNALVAVWLIVALTTRLKLPPSVAFIVSLPFVIPTPAVGSQLLETAGASVEPFVYVLALWYLRRRPLAFGMVLALGFMHREFTILAAPALMLVEAASGELWTRSSLRRAGRMALGFALVWLIVDDLKMHLGGGPAILQATSLGDQMCLDVRSLAGHAQALAALALPSLFGARPMPLSAFRMTTDLVAGSTFVGWLLVLAFALMVIRLALLWRCRQEADTGSAGGSKAGFAAYLAWTGALTAAAYPLSCSTGGLPLLRYLVLVLLLPIGLAALFLQNESSRRLRALVLGVLTVWSATNLLDNMRLVHASIAEPPSNEHRALADYLVVHRIRYARAIYWDAYAVDFLSRERVITASVDIVRIPEYQKAVDEHADAAVNLARLPCEGGDRVASWCIQKD